MRHACPGQGGVRRKDKSSGVEGDTPHQVGGGEGRRYGREASIGEYRP